jgi:hypothetical protein
MTASEVNQITKLVGINQEIVQNVTFKGISARKRINPFTFNIIK